MTFPVATMCYTSSCRSMVFMHSLSLVRVRAAIHDGIISKEELLARLPNDDYDGAWKAALGVYLQEFLALCFPAMHTAIDWSRPYRFLETELQRATSDDQQGRRTADKLVEVWGRDGVAAWVLIHIEVQSQDASDFPARMFQYHHRLRDRFDRPIVSIAVLDDDRPRWRPATYEAALWGCEVRFRFPIVKLLDYQGQLVELEHSRNPVASLILAHLAARRTRADPAQRLLAKLAISRRLYDLGYSAEQVRLAFGFVDWLLRLPDTLREQFVQELRTFEEERQMSYITSIEELGIEKGRAAGLLDGIVLALDLKFGETAAPVIAEVRQLNELSLLEAVLAHIKTAATIDDVRRVYAPSADPEH